MQHPYESKGERFEREVLGVSGRVNRLDTFTDFSTAIRAVVQSSDYKCPDTGTARRLFYFVKKFLGRHAALGDLRFLRAIDSPADILHGADAFFYFKIMGREYIASVDLFYVEDDRVIQLITGWFGPDLRIYNSTQLSMKAIRSIMTDEANYTNFQSQLFNFKRKLGGKILYPRYENHFILTPFDVNRGKGLRDLGKLIASYFRAEIAKNSP